MARLQTILRLASFAVATWVLGVILWGLLAVKDKIETPLVAIWLFLGITLLRLVLWTVSKLVTRT